MTRRVVVAVPDLFFCARIGATAKMLGVQVDEVPIEQAGAACRAGPAAMVLVDLEAPGAVEMVRAFKADPALAAVPVVGFYPHVNVGTRAAAVAAGIDRALTRSAFTTLLPTLLAGEAPADQ